MPKILPMHRHPILKIVKTRTHRSPSNEPIFWHDINPWVKCIHYFHILIDDYEGHTFCTFELPRNSSQETYIIFF